MAGILLVDDQSIVRSGMIKMIRDMRLGMGAVYEAADGVEALEIAVEKRPEVILVDIMMPRLGGLQFIEELSKGNITCHIIIISAYSDFSFAKKAINFKVDDYLLKPVSKKQLFKVLISTKEKIQKEMNKVKAIKEQEYQYYYMLLYEYLTGSDVFLDAEKLFERVGKTLRYPFFKLEIIYFNSVEQAERICIKQMLDEQLKKNKHAFVTFDNGSGMLICIYNVMQKEDTSCEELAKKCLNSAKIIYNCGLSDTMEGFQSLRKLYRRADIALKESIFKKTNFCAFADIKKEHKLFLNKNEYDLIINLLERGVKDELDRKIIDIFERMAEADLSFSSVENNLYNLVNYIYLNLKDSYPGFLDIEPIKEDLQKARNIFNIKVVIIDAIGNAYDYIRQYNTKDNPNYVIDYIIKYIKSNYQREISLAEVANNLSMNYSYISNIFSLKAGKSFSEYIMQVRLDKARELLTESDIKIYEVAEKSGYPDAKYFARVFKKHFNASPVDYREEHLKKYSSQK